MAEDAKTYVCRKFVNKIRQEKVGNSLLDRELREFGSQCNGKQSQRIGKPSHFIVIPSQ